MGEGCSAASAYREEKLVTIEKHAPVIRSNCWTFMCVLQGVVTLDTLSTDMNDEITLTVKNVERRCIAHNPDQAY